MCIKINDSDYIVDGDASAELLGPWISTIGVDALLFHVKWAAAGSSSGSLQLQGASDAADDPIGLAVVVPGGSTTLSTSSAGAQFLSAAGPGMTNGIPLPALVRFRFAHTSGSGGLLQVSVTGR